MESCKALKGLKSLEKNGESRDLSPQGSPAQGLSPASRANRWSEVGRTDSLWTGAHFPARLADADRPRSLHLMGQSESPGSDGQQSVLVTQQVQSEAGSQHRPGSEEQQVVPGREVLRVAGEGGDSV